MQIARVQRLRERKMCAFVNAYVFSFDQTAQA